MRVGVRGHSGSWASPYVTQLLLEVIPPGAIASWWHLLCLWPVGCLTLLLLHLGQDLGPTVGCGGDERRAVVIIMMMVQGDHYLVLITRQAALKGFNTQFMQLSLHVGMCCYTCYTDEETEAQRHEETCSVTQQ